MSDAAARWRRLEAVVQSTLEHPTEQRAAFLAQACRGDDDLRRDAEALLQREGPAEGFLRHDLGALAANAMTYSPGGTPASAEAGVAIGDRLGQYEIRARLGAGGMGEVYQAFDHTLSRDVAIKLLPAIFSSDPERLARFEREARLLASLAHPHIGAIYGLERSGDLRAIVLELIDGETLEARLRRGGVPVVQALAIAVQIAEALDHAHRRGVTHRDLKPANVMLTRAGAKLLDFGLAKWGARAGFVSTPSAVQPRRPDGVETLTLEGTILGTPHYMAPEQLEGRAVDARADVFAFGAVLFEMLTARKAFDAGSTAAVMAAVLNTEPSFTAPPSLPPALERVIRKCLAKDPEDRWQTTRDLADELKWIAGAPLRTGNEPIDKLATGNRRRFGLAAIAVLTLIAVALTGWAIWRIASGRIQPPDERVIRFAIQPSPLTGTSEFAVSPDGATLAYILQEGTTSRLFVRRFDQFEHTEIPGSDGAATPLFSPDGIWVAFWSNRQLRKVNIQTNAAPTVVSDQPEDLWNGATWLDDGRIIFARTEHGLQQVPDNGGKAVDFTARDEAAGERDHHHPVMLPGGDTVLFTVHDQQGFHIVAETLATHQRKRLIDSAYDARYLPTGYLSFSRGSTILTVPFDVKRLEVTGPELTMVESVQGSAFDGRGGYQLSANGTLVFQSRPQIHGRTLTWVDRAGVETPLPLPSRGYNSPSVSPDGTQIAFSVTHQAGRDVYLYNLATGREDRLTRVGDNRTPLWTRDGQELTYSTATRSDEGKRQLVSVPADQSRLAEPLVSGFLGLVPGAWTRNKTQLFYVDNDTSAKGHRMFSLSPAAPGRIESVADGPGQERQPDLSPDDRWLAFNSANEIYLTSTGSLTSARQISTEGGREPKWSRDGREIFYRSGSRMMAVSVDPATGRPTGKSRLLFEKQNVAGGADSMGLSYDLTPDGRFLMIRSTAEEQALQPLRVIVNWATETVRRVSTSR